MIYLEPHHWKIIRQILGDYRECFYAFGSRVKGTHKVLSDLDLMYEDNVPDQEIARMLLAFDDSLLPFKVDIVNLAHCSPEFRSLILADRIRLT